MTCLYCKGEFEPTRQWQKFCNDKCRNSYHADVKDGLIVEEIPVIVIETTLIKCPHCGTNSNTPNLIEQISPTKYLCIVCSKEFPVLISY